MPVALEEKRGLVKQKWGLQGCLRSHKNFRLSYPKGMEPCLVLVQGSGIK